MQWQTSVMTTLCIRELNWIAASIELSPCKNKKRKQQKPQNTPKKKKTQNTRKASTAFFFLRCGRSRSKARSLHENKLLSRKLQHGHRWSHANWQIITTQTKNTTTKGQDADPPARFASHHHKTAKQTAKGARAQQKQPQKICQRHSSENPLCRKLKNMQQTN